MCMGGILASGAIQTSSRSRGGRSAPFWKVDMFFSLDIFQLFRHPIWFSRPACPSSKTLRSAPSHPPKAGMASYRPACMRRPSDLPAPITLLRLLGTSYILMTIGSSLYANRNALRQGFRPFISELATAPVMRITSDLHQRSRKKSLRTFLKKNLVPHFSLDIFQLYLHPILRLSTILRSSRARMSV